MDRLIIGIDPGKSGGIAWCRTALPRAEAFGCCKMPESAPAVAQVLRSLIETEEFEAVYVFLEKVHSSPQMGVVSAFTFGNGVGVLRGVCAALRLSLVEVQSKAWRRLLGVPTASGQGGFGKRDGDQKRVNKDFAAAMFPEFKVIHATADALLLTEYGLRIHGGAAANEKPF